MHTTPNVKVTALIITYNHIAFIGRALDSALAQQTSFDYEILVSEDCSTDGTRELVRSYQERHPHKIRLLLSEQNVRSNAVVRRGLIAAAGEYVALLDGDDYWTSPHKLQRQADFLDQHADCAMCFHNAEVHTDSAERPPWRWTPESQPQRSTLDDILMGNFIATCASMFRQAIIKTIPAWYDRLFPITDWPLHIHSAERGAIGYIPELMGVYRYHEGGLYSPLSQQQKIEKTVQFYRTMDANLGYRYRRQIKTATVKYVYDWAKEYMRRGELAQAKRCFALSMRAWAPNRFVSLRQLLRMGVRLYAPGPAVGV